MKIIEAKASNQQAHEDLSIPDPPREVVLAVIAGKPESGQKPDRDSDKPHGDTSH